jgi:hypothetical protein
MNGMLPVTSMLPRDLSPGRKLIVADPSKLTYFARANAVRSGVYNAWGSLGGLGFPGDGDETAIREAEQSSGVSDADKTKAAGTFQTVGDFFGQIGRSLLGSASTPAPVIVQQAPNPAPYIVAGVAAVGVLGFIGYKLMKK